MHSKTKQAALPPPTGTQVTEQLPDKSDRAVHRQACKELFTSYFGAHVFAKQTSFMVTLDESAKDAATEFIKALRESIRPRDAFEELLIVQYVWTHARLGKLSMLASNQELTANLRVVNEACDRAANTLRKLMLTLAEYRRPPRQDQFVAIRQANVAAQQVVQNNVEHASAKGRKDANEQGCAVLATVPAVPGGAGGAAGLGLPEPALGLEHGPDLASGDGAVEPQRGAARGTKRADGGGPAGAEGRAAGSRRRRKP